MRHNIAIYMGTFTALVLAGFLALATADSYHPDEPGSVRGTVRSDELSASFWQAQAQATVKRRAGTKTGPAARNVILFLGDGMSVPTLAAARTLLGQRRGYTGEEAELSFESFPTSGLSKTYCVNAQVADSACSATAYLCGVKANQGTLGVSASVPRSDCGASLEPTARLQSIAAWALADGRDAGLVTTTRVTHASPAATFARAANRNWENDASVRADGADPQQCPDIATQLITENPGRQFKVILGGGRREFLPRHVVDEEGSNGTRTDGRNLIDEWRSDKIERNVTHSYVWNREQLLSANATMPEYLIGLFESSHLRYNMLTNPTTEPSLAELTEVAIRMLQRNDKGFFLFVEGGRIDHAHHSNYAELALDETIELSAAVSRAAELLDERDSLLVVTADHAHVMSYNGYAARGSNILGTARAADRDGVPYMTLSYTNGPGFRAHVEGKRVDITTEGKYGSMQWRSHVDVPLSSETHGGDDVAVFARGPQHALFSGLYEQNAIPHLMAYAACIGPGEHVCNNANIVIPLSSLLSSLILIIFCR